MDNVIDVPECHFEAILVAYIADKITHCRIMLAKRRTIAHFELFHLIARKYDDFARTEFVEDRFAELFPKRAGPTRNEH